MWSPLLNIVKIKWDIYQWKRKKIEIFNGRGRKYNHSYVISLWMVYQWLVDEMVIPFWRKMIFNRRNIIKQCNDNEQKNNYSISFQSVVRFTFTNHNSINWLALESLDPKMSVNYYILIVDKWLRVLNLSRKN